MDLVRDAPILHRNDTLATSSEFGVVCYKNECRSRSAMQRENEVHDLRASFAVEISGWLVCKQDFGLGRERACQRDALLLSA